MPPETGGLLSPETGGLWVPQAVGGLESVCPFNGVSHGKGPSLSHPPRDYSEAVYSLSHVAHDQWAQLSPNGLSLGQIIQSQPGLHGQAMPFFNAAPINGYQYYWPGSTQSALIARPYVPYYSPSTGPTTYVPTSPSALPGLDASAAGNDADTQTSDNNGAHRCPHGCRGTFRRDGDYRRHMRKHVKPRYRCPVMDCDMTFYRADKMRDHLRQGHKGLKL
jgi:hypothetical protein